MIRMQYQVGNRRNSSPTLEVGVFLLEKDKLVKKGYARVYYVYGKYKYTNKLRASEKVAKRKKLGV